MQANQAIQFVVEQGNDIEQARLRYLLDKTQPTPAILAQFTATQRQDGGWSPFWATEYSSVDATCYHLAQAEQLGLEMKTVAVAQATAFLMSRQQTDGTWQEDVTVAELAPPWAKPGDLAATTYLTANAGYWLARHLGMSDQVMQAATWLKTHSNGGQLPSFLHAHWLAAGLWYKLDWYDQAAQIMVYLQSKMDEMAADNLAWLVTTLRSVGVPAHHPLLTAAIARLMAQQQADGHWPSDDGAAFHVHVTLEALRALQLCGAF